MEPEQSESILSHSLQPWGCGDTMLTFSNSITFLFFNMEIPIPKSEKTIRENPSGLMMRCSSSSSQYKEKVVPSSPSLTHWQNQEGKWGPIATTGERKSQDHQWCYMKQCNIIFNFGVSASFIPVRFYETFK